MDTVRCSVLALLLATASAGCAEHEASQGVLVASPVAYVTHLPAGGGHDGEGPAVLVLPERARRVLILQGRKLDRPAEVVGIVDAHEPSGRQDAAFAGLQQRAAAMGADAVIGVEFHHGESHGEPIHLSGLAVRFLDQAP